MYHADRGIGQMDAHRQNNFDLLRIGAAALVFLSHCWSLTESGRDPADALMLHVFTGGELGVWIFFAISGYLVTASFMTRGSAIAFAKARILRIYPAFVAAIMYGIAVGAIVTRLPIADYFRSSETLSYLSGNLTFDIQYHLPGVFARNPHSSLVNRSLWTLPGEVFMYCVVGLLGAIGVLHRRPRATAVIASLVIMLAVWPTAILHLPLVGGAKLAAPMCSSAWRCLSSAAGSRFAPRRRCSASCLPQPLASSRLAP
jgi:peptidoglycan/LPS O-acetylase OafA/YrhL